MLMQIIGLDVGYNNVVAYTSIAPTSNLREVFNAEKSTIPKFLANRKGIEDLLALKPDICVMEPTGIHYSEFWYKCLSHAGVEIRWVGHIQVKNFRRSHRLPDKNDKADAFALACYCRAHLTQPEFFLDFQPFPVDRLRRLTLQLSHLNRIQNPMVNCARQYLAHEFPEAANRKSRRGKIGDVPPLWGWLALERPSSHFERLWEHSIAIGYGLTISDFTRKHAKRICDLERQQDLIEQELRSLLKLPCFTAYNKVFDDFNMGLRVRSHLLSHMYPLETFFGADGKPVVEAVKTDSGKINKRNRSLRAFKLKLGMGLIESSSGKSSFWTPGGSSTCRTAIWQWIITTIAPRRARATPIAQELGEYLDKLKAGGTPPKLAQSKCAARAVTLLFKKLTQELTHHRVE